MDFDIYTSSDHHTSNRNINDFVLLESLRNSITDTYDSVPNLKLINFTGDFYDRYLALNSEEGGLGHSFMMWLIHYCVKRKIYFRLLEGTPSHDWRQLKFVKEYCEKYLDADDRKYIKYCDTLEIEYIEELNIDLLYLPDEYLGSTKLAWVAVQELLAEKGLDAVDIVLMHGQFEYQFSGNINFPEHTVHNADDYNSIAKYVVFCGHVHKHSTYERIVVPGSFGRIAHNEEHDKGYVVSRLINDVIRHQFVPNERATIFKTYDVFDKSPEETFALLDSVLPKFKDGSHIRIKCKYADVDHYNIKDLKAAYPEFNWKTEPLDAPEKTVTLRTNSRYSGIQIGPDTVITLMCGLALEKGHSEERTQAIADRMEEYV